MKFLQLVIVVAILLPSSAYGDRRIDLTQFRILPLLPAYSVLGQTPLHEGSHALAASVFGMRVNRVIPYPHSYRENNTRRFAAGSVRVEMTGTRSEICGVYMSPYFTDVIMFTSVDLLLHVHPTLENSIGGAILYMVGMLFPYIDFVINFFNSTSDWRQASIASGRPEVIYSVGAVLLAVATWRLIATGYRVFTREV
jgi:hypothetical protein